MTPPRPQQIVTLIIEWTWKKSLTYWTSLGISLAEKVFDRLLQLPFDLIPF